MKKVKLILGLSLCLGALLSLGTLEKSSKANIGYAIASYTNANGAEATAEEAGVGAMGAYEGAEIGEDIGWLGGPGEGYSGCRCRCIIAV